MADNPTTPTSVRQATTSGGNVRFSLIADTQGDTRRAVTWAMSTPVRQLTTGMANLVGAGSLAGLLYAAVRSSTVVTTMFGTIFQLLGAFVDLLAIQFLPVFVKVTTVLAGALGKMAGMASGGFSAKGVGGVVGGAAHGVWEIIEPGFEKFLTALPKMFGTVLEMFIKVFTDPAIIRTFLNLAFVFVSTIIKHFWPFMIAIGEFLMGKLIAGFAMGAMIQALASGNFIGAGIASGFLAGGGILMLGGAAKFADAAAQMASGPSTLFGGV